MKAKFFQFIKSPQLLWQALMLSLPLLLLLGMGLWVYDKHQWALQELATVEPRYARMLGMREQQGEIDQALQRLQALRAQYIYPGAEAGAQAGAAVQQKLRSIMGVAGLSVTSSQVQVRPAEEEKSPYERIVISITAEGEMANVYTALQGLYDIRPTIWVDELSINRNGNLDSGAGVQVAPVMNLQLMVSILKNKET